MNKQEINNKTNLYAHTKISLQYIGRVALKFRWNSLHLIALLSYYISTSSLPQQMYLSYRGTSFSSPGWQMDVRVLCYQAACQNWYIKLQNI